MSKWFLLIASIHCVLSHSLSQTQESLILKESSIRSKYRLFLNDNDLPWMHVEFGLGYGGGVASTASQEFAITPRKHIDILATHIRVSFNVYLKQQKNPYFLKLLSPQLGFAVSNNHFYVFAGTPGIGFGKHIGLNEKKRVQISVNAHAVFSDNYPASQWFVPVIMPQIKWLNNRFSASFELSYLPHREKKAQLSYYRQTYYFGVTLGFTNAKKLRYKP